MGEFESGQERQGLKPKYFQSFTARLKSCPDTKPKLSVAKSCQSLPLVGHPRTFKNHTQCCTAAVPKQTNRTLVHGGTFFPSSKFSYALIKEALRAKPGSSESITPRLKPCPYGGNRVPTQALKPCPTTTTVFPHPVEQRKRSQFPRTSVCGGVPWKPLRFQPTSSPNPYAAVVIRRCWVFWGR